MLGFVTEDLLHCEDPDPTEGAADNEPIYRRLDKLEDDLDKVLIDIVPTR